MKRNNVQFNPSELSHCKELSLQSIDRSGIPTGFKDNVLYLVGKIPQGRVMTYGQIAALCGQPRAARIVGGIAHWTLCAGLASCLGTGGSGLNGVQGNNEERASRTSGTVRETRKQLTPQSAKSIDRISDSVTKQVNATCPSCDLPWHRAVYKDGKLAVGYPGGVDAQRQHLEAEGIKVSKYYKIDIDRLQWQPE